MSQDFLQLIVNSSGAVAVTGLFTLYLIKRDRKDEKIYTHFNEVIHDIQTTFNKTIQEHMRESNKVQQEQAVRLQQLTDTIKELKDVIQKMYKELLSKTKEINQLKKV